MDAVPAQPSCARLAALAALATEAGAESLAREAQALAVRVQERRFYVACVGQFKRGKSSLINALVGEPILPVGLLPVTAAITVLRYGDRLAARVQLAEGGWRAISPQDLALYVAEEQNPENRRAVRAVEVFVPSALLATGLCLVDTPGLGSIYAGNTETARAFVPHIDAALVVLGADPPIGADEMALIEAIGRECRELVFVLNKADKHDAEALQAVSAFTAGVLAGRLGASEVRVLAISAAERLAGQGPPRDWPELLAALERLAQEAGSELVVAAAARGTALLQVRLRRQLEEARDALQRPLAASAQRVDLLHACASAAERSLADLGYLLAAERARLSRRFSDQRERFLAAALPSARAELAGALSGLPTRRGPALRSQALAYAQAGAERWLDRWRAEAGPAAEQLYVEGTRRFSELAADFLERLARSGEPALTGLPRAIAPELGWRAPSGFYYTSLMATTGQGPAGWLQDVLRARQAQLRALEREQGEYIEALIRTNASRIANDFDDRVLESQRRVETELRTLLSDLAGSAEQALLRARELQEQGEHAVQCELEIAEARLARLQALDG